MWQTSRDNHICGLIKVWSTSNHLISMAMHILQVREPVAGMWRAGLKQNISRQLDLFPESTSSNGSAHVQLSAMIEIHHYLQQKILQRMKKRYVVTAMKTKTPALHIEDCSHESKKAHRHQRSSVTSSQLREGKTGELNSKINLNIKIKLIQNRNIQKV